MTGPSAADRIAAVLQTRFPRNDVAPAHYGELLRTYADSGIGPPHLLHELETGDEGKLWSCIWEAMLYRHLRSLGYELSGSVSARAQHGPDFRFERDGLTIWVEAVVPSPEGIPSDWLAPPMAGEVKAVSKPHREMLLRCTSAIADKQKKFTDYRAKGIVGQADAAVIAVNICRLSDWDIDGTGVSQLPLMMEAVFPIGAIAVPISREGKIDGPAQHLHRFSIDKADRRTIPTGYFLDPKFANVSAVLQAHQKDVFQKELVLAAAHNPLASNALPTGLFDLDQEYVAEPVGEEFQIRKM
jgi:hypothetical protein